jgi:hypothetical protein
MSKSTLNSALETQETDWTKVLFEVIIKILTLGFYHIKKHQKG